MKTSEYMDIKIKYICVHIKMKFRTSLPSKNKCFIHEQSQSGSSRYIFDFEIWKLDSSRGYKITFYEAWHHRIVSKVPTLWRSHMLNSSPGRWQQNLRIKTDLPPDLHSPDKQLSVAALLVQALTRKVTCRKYKISHNVKGYPRYIYFYTSIICRKEKEK